MNNRIRKENKMLLLVGIIFFLVLVFSIVVSAGDEHKEIKTPILDQSVVPGYFLGSSKLCKSWDEILDNVNVKARFFFESWNSLPREEIRRLRKERIRETNKLREKGMKDENIKKHLKKSNLKHIEITITIFKSENKASKWAVPYLKSQYTVYKPILKEGILCGEKIGEKCWVSRGKETLSVDFLKNNCLVTLILRDPEGVDEAFALKVAKNIAKKL